MLFQGQYIKVKNLIIFRCNIYIINVLKQDKNYFTKVYTNIKDKVLSWKRLLTVYKQNQC